MKTIRSVRLLGGEGSMLAKELKRTGIPLDKLAGEQTPELLIIDGIHPPAAESRSLIGEVFHKGGTVLVWGVSPQGLAALNSLLPADLEITSWTSSSLLPVTDDPLITGISAADCYFSESRPAEIITNGLAGPLVGQSTVLLEAAGTDWLKWNKQPEYAKTAMVVRSEREQHLSGITLLSKKVGEGRLIVTTLPAAPKLAKAEKLVRRILANTGIPLEVGNDAGRPLLKDGTLVRALYAGNFPISSLQDGVANSLVDPSSGDLIRADAKVEGKSWTPVFNENGVLDLSRIKAEGPHNNMVAYLSFWVASPRSLEDLLSEPDIPVVNMEVTAGNAVQVYLNGKMIIDNSHLENREGGKAKAGTLKLRQGWNHFLVKLIVTDGKAQFSGQLSSSQPDFLADLSSALERP